MATKRRSKYAEHHPKEGIHLLPKTDKQKEYIDALKVAPQIIVTGPAGTGKTYIAATKAAQLLEANIVDRIILTRPNVPAGRSLGFFPGTMEEKIAPWIVPFIEVLEEQLGKEAVEIALKKGNISVVPFEVMRGRTFKNAFVILDEAQNASAHELKMFLSRIGENAQCVLNGDVMQSDLRNECGLKVVIDLVNKQKLPVPVIEFTLDDIVRSDICAMWIKAFVKSGI
jgi:phosphate starvation-inducible protein PhoH and related proteins